jgi:hypothetical protein
MSKKLNFDYNLALGLPLRRSDLQHIYQKIAEVEAVAGGLAGQGPVILQGVSITQTIAGTTETTACSEGWLYYEGDILRVEASSVSRQFTSSQVPIWVLQEVNGPHEPHLLDDFQTLHVFTSIRLARLQIGAPGGAGAANYICDLSHLKKPFKETADRLDSIESGYASWQPVITTPGSIIASTASGERSWNYSRIGRKATLSFYQIFSVLSPGSFNGLSFSLPPGMSIDFQFQCAVPVAAKRASQSDWQPALAFINLSGQSSNANVVEIETSPGWDTGVNNRLSGQIEIYTT